LTEFQSWVCKAVTDMVVHQSDAGLSICFDRFRCFVEKQVSTVAEGNRAAFCKALGFHGRGLNGWLNKGERPSITHFLSLCYRLPEIRDDTGHRPVRRDIDPTGAVSLQLWAQVAHGQDECFDDSLACDEERLSRLRIHGWLH